VILGAVKKNIIVYAQGWENLQAVQSCACQLRDGLHRAQIVLLLSDPACTFS
jgi:hypothetical protein